MLLRRRRTQGLVAACALLVALGAARAEDSQPLSGRVMQWFGLGGAQGQGSDASRAEPADAPPPAPKADETSAQPLPEGTYIPGANVIIVGDGPVQSRVLKMMGLTGGDDAADGAAAEAARKKALASGITECPDIVVDGSGAEMRSPTGADASSVAYQISITRMARECGLAGENLSVRVGLLGAAMLGPAGKPGGYFGSLRVALRRKSDNRLFGEKTYRVGATIPANQSRADFTLLVEDLSAPFVNAKAAEDYEVLVGFTKGERGRGGGKEARQESRRLAGRHLTLAQRQGTPRRPPLDPYPFCPTGDMHSCGSFMVSEVKTFERNV